MMDVSLIVQLLKLSQSLWAWAKENKLIGPKEDQQVAQTSFEVLNETEAGKVLLDQIAALSEEEADKLWDDMLSHGLPVADQPAVVSSSPSATRKEGETK